MLPGTALASMPFHPMGLLDHGEVELKISEAWVQQEREYENESLVLDERDYQSLHSRLEIGLGLWDRFTFRGGLKVATNGELRKRFDSSIPLNDDFTTYEGIRSISASLQYYSQEKQLAFEVYAESGLPRARETNASLGGTNAGMAFKYLHELSWVTIFGHIFVQVDGKKRTWRLDGEREVLDPYTKFGNELNFRFDFNHFWVRIGGHFMLTTDFVTRSPSLNRHSDKGFGPGGIFELGLQYPKWAIRIWHERSGEVFNVIPEEPNLQYEFELEEQSSGLELSWHW